MSGAGEEEEEEELEVDGSAPVANVSLISSHHLMNVSGLSPHKVQVMKASLFQGEEEGEEPRAGADHSGRSPLLSHQQGRPPPSRSQPTTKSSFRTTSMHSSGLLKATSHHHPPPQHYLAPPFSTVSSPSSESKRVDAMSIAYAHTIQPVQSSLSLSKQKSVVLVPASSSLVRSRANMVADLGLFLGRSFRCGWGSNWTFAHCGTPLSELKVEGASFGDRGGPFSPSFVPERKCEPLSVKVERLQVRPEGEDCLVREGIVWWGRDCLVREDCLVRGGLLVREDCLVRGRVVYEGEDCLVREVV